MLNKSLFAKMLTTYLCVTLSLLILLGVTVSTVFRTQYISQKESELMRETEEIHTIIVEKYMDDAKRAVAKDELVTIARKYDALIQAYFIDPLLGRVVLMNEESKEKWAPIADININKYYDRIVLTGTAEGEIYTNLFKGTIGSSLSTMTLARPIISAENTSGALFFSINMEDTNTAIRQVYFDILLSATLAIILAILAVSYLTSRITTPITNMKRIVTRYAKGEFDIRVEYKGEDEVGALAKSFNTMADGLNTLEEARRSFVSNVSHELRSPLTSMRGFLVAMQDGTIPVSEFDKYLKIVIDENNRMTTMVNGLLDLARIESGQTAFKPTVFDINELIRRTLITFITRVNEKELNVKIIFGNEQVFVLADHDQIAQVIRNLVDNAIKYSDNKGELEISVKTIKRVAYISVRDSGNGISENDIPYIFDRFYKVEKAHTPSHTSGTGLGLAIVKRIIDAHGQMISVKNENGAVFTFTLKQVELKPRWKDGNDI